jgi:hypothetical protein
MNGIFHPEQEYVNRIAADLGLELKPKLHTRATDTCDEKAELLRQTYPDEGWVPERVVKAIYIPISMNGNGTKFFGFVYPELQRRLHRRDVRRLLDENGITRYGEGGIPIPSTTNITKGMSGKGMFPKGMELGTCSPFPLESSMLEEIGAILVHDMKYDGDPFVDISVGGYDEEAHKASLHLPYSGIYSILSKRFGGGMVKIADIFSM